MTPELVEKIKALCEGKLTDAEIGALNMAAAATATRASALPASPAVNSDPRAARQGGWSEGRSGFASMT